jgi:anti-sigma-K factor RskA
MSTHEIEHDRLREASGLYVLGALDDSERSAFERHLSECTECSGEVRAFGGVTAALAHGVPQIDPAPSLRQRILAVTGRPRVAASNIVAMPPRVTPQRARAAWLSAAALLVVAVGAGSYAWSLRGRIGQLEVQLREAMTRLARSEEQVAVATRAVATAETRVAILTAPDMLQVNLQGQAPVAPRASGRAFWSRSRGLVFTASSLPSLPAGRVYQLWMVTATAPVSAGLLRPDPEGQVAQAFETPADVPTPVALAVTLEPEGGVPAPTGDKYLVGLTQ